MNDRESKEKKRLSELVMTLQVGTQDAYRSHRETTRHLKTLAEIEREIQKILAGETEPRLF
jgi:hypothetical protein